MSRDYPAYELLAKYLDAEFGNIYEYRFAEGQDAEGNLVTLDYQEWTDELHTAVRQYLLHDLPADVRDRLFRSKDGATTDVNVEERVDRLLQLEPWEVAFEVRNAAVTAVPTLRELIGNLDSWPSGEESADAIVWLEAHSTISEWRAVAEASKHGELREILASNQKRSLAPDDLVRVLSPKELLAAWSDAVAPASTDLTDAEWQLLTANFPKRRDTAPGSKAYRTPSEWELIKKRPTLNTLRYKYLKDVGWNDLPPRYTHNGLQILRYYQRQGLFRHLRDALKDNDNTDARNLVAWLDQMIADTPKKQTPQQSKGTAA
ncbi:hypothetical protein ACWESM_13420 [Nocardia sp. NPDC003999]